MKNVYHVKCDYCGCDYTVTMHKAEFDRCYGGVCCKQECLDQNTAAIQKRIADYFVDTSATTT